MKNLILASSSPRRKMIFDNLGLDFVCEPSTYEENLENFKFSYEKIENLAYNKAFTVAKNKKNKFLVIGADTVVVLDDTILGKPKSMDDAYKMLKFLSGREHFVVTSICAIETPNMRKKIVSTTSYVEFNNLSDEMIKYYIEVFKPFDKAGAYGIQELPSGYVKSINGSFENIVGLCPKALKKVIKTFKDKNFYK